jgi:hypothetical protein
MKAIAKQTLRCLGVSAVIWLAGCSKNGTPADPTLLNNGFKGITQTQNDPTSIGWNDPDDWKSDGGWNYAYPNPTCTNPSIPAELEDGCRGNLGKNSQKNGCQVPDHFWINAAYPNPITDTCVFSFAMAYESKVYLSVVNDKYQVVKLLACTPLLTAGYWRIRWNLTGDNGQKVPSDVYRCVFRISDKDGNTILVSHGDIWVQ